MTARPFLGARFRLRVINGLVHEGVARRDARRFAQELSDDTIIDCCVSVSAAVGLTPPVGEFGDGKYLETFLNFLMEHWDEILALVMKFFV